MVFGECIEITRIVQHPRNTITRGGDKTSVEVVVDRSIVGGTDFFKDSVIRT